jgi:LysM repeat protein
MTRETKIGLLVGLGFMIVIGILLSNQFNNSNDAPPASLTNAGNGVRQAISSPGESSAPPVTTVVTPVVTPQQPVATQAEVTPPTPAIQIVRIGGPNTGGVQRQPERSNAAPAPLTVVAKSDSNASSDTQAASSDTPGNDAPVITPVKTAEATTPSDSDLSKVAAEHGEQLVNADDNSAENGSGQSGTGQSYTAQPGDSLSRIASHFYGNGGKANRDLIIKANPALAANEDMIIAGKTYRIPAKGAAKPKAAVAEAGASDDSPALAQATTTQDAPAQDTRAQDTAAQNTAAQALDDSTAKTAAATEDKSSQPVSDAGYLYTVQPGDNLTRIARDEVGDVHAIAAIQELNGDRLKGPNHDILIAGCKIRLPGKPLAKAE